MDDNLNESNPDLNASLLPLRPIGAQPLASPSIAQPSVVPVATPSVTPPIQVATDDMSQEKYIFPDLSNEELENRMKKEKMKSVFRYASLVLLVLALSATGILGYNVITKNETIKNKEAALVSKEEEAIKQEAIVKKLQDDLATATVTLATTNTALATANDALATANTALATATAPATTTTTKKSTSTSTQESVVAPPAPPSN